MSNKVKVNLSEFLLWAEDKIQVSWCYGSLCESESLGYFEPNCVSESVEGFLGRVVDWVDENSYVKERYDEDGKRCDYDVDEYVFHFFNDELGEEYDEYQEESMNIEELIECYHNTLNVNMDEFKLKKARYDVLDELQDILLEEEDFERADEYIKENDIKMSECDVIMENAIGLEEISIVKYLVERGMKMDKKWKKELNRCNREFKEIFEQCVVG